MVTSFVDVFILSFFVCIPDLKSFKNAVDHRNK